MPNNKEGTYVGNGYIFDDGEITVIFNDAEKIIDDFEL